MLQDMNIYEVVERNSMRRIVMGLHALLVSWKEKKYIANSIYRNLLSNNGASESYTLSKIHKQDCLFHVIFSSINNPLYSLAVFLHNIIIKTIPETDSHIENSKLVKELNGRRLSDEFQLMSLEPLH